jgi:hypothetical protein
MLWPQEYLKGVSGKFLHTGLKFHPYKMMVVQELRERDWLSRQASCKAILDNVPADADVLCSDKVHFHLSGCVNEQTILSNSMSDLSTVSVLLFGVVLQNLE